MKMRPWMLAATAVLAVTIPTFAQLAPRPSATYTLVLNDDGTGTLARRHWAVYGDITSPGYAGIYAFGVDFVDGSVTSIQNVSPKGVFNSASESEMPRPIGFTFIRTVTLDRGTFTGSQELVNPDAIMEYSFGVSDGRLDSTVVGDGGPWTFKSAVQNSYHGHLLLGVGTFGEVLPEFDAASPDNVIGAFVDPSSRQNRRAIMALITRDLVFDLGQNGGNLPEPAGAALLVLVWGSLLTRRFRGNRSQIR